MSNGMYAVVEACSRNKKRVLKIALLWVGFLNPTIKKMHGKEK
ncbi:hypothetical protein l11_00040 [Neisseria weaveri LMG 5135]|nr:hypothetical protein l13_05520 [Neisseria weaveri ATCC 51223]EGV38925.1 hypothetical protein l11_00040 [Neisseria weaveri LMG 5135]